MSDLLLKPSDHIINNPGGLLTVGDGPPAFVTGTNIPYNPPVINIYKDWGAGFFAGVSVDEIPNANNGVRLIINVAAATSNGLYAVIAFGNIANTSLAGGWPGGVVGLVAGKTSGAHSILPFYKNNVGALVTLPTFNGVVGANDYPGFTFGNGKFSVGIWPTPDRSLVPAYLQTATDVGPTVFQYSYLCASQAITGSDVATITSSDFRVAGYGPSGIANNMFDSQIFNPNMHKGAL